MCGFTAQVFGRECSADPEDIENLVTCSKRLSARGPNEFGIFSRQSCSAIHYRLPIIDIDGSSQQPFFDSKLNVLVLFNGCIYNFKEKRSELIKKGYEFYSEGDTEVVAKLYHCYREGFTKHIEGIYSIFIFDFDLNISTLARDRFGVKPLYYFLRKDVFLISSDIRCLLRHPSCAISLNLFSICSYSMLHSIVPSPDTLFNEIRRVSPGELMQVQFGKVIWSGKTETKGQPPGSREFVESEFYDILQSAILKQTVSDAELSVLLSGGLDSSLIAAILAESGVNFETYSIGFPDTKEEVGNEFEYSDQVVTTLGMPHTKIIVSEHEIWENITSSVHLMMEPMASHDCVAFFLLGKEVGRRHRVTICGQGADEVFGGYHWHNKISEDVDFFKQYESLFFDHPIRLSLIHI